MAGTAKFTQADVKRAIRGATKAGYQVARAEIEQGSKIVVVMGAKLEEPVPAADVESWVRKHAHKG
jgi:hypothetical protein